MGDPYSCTVQISLHNFETIVSKICTLQRGQRVPLFASLVAGRKWFYNDPAEWAVELLLLEELRPVAEATVSGETLIGKADSDGRRGMVKVNVWRAVWCASDRGTERGFCAYNPATKRC